MGLIVAIIFIYIIFVHAKPTGKTYPKNIKYIILIAVRDPTQ